MTALKQLRLRLIITSLFVTGIGLVALPILAGLLVVSFYALLTVTSTYARNTKRQTQVKQIIVAANEFYKQNQRYPNTLQELEKYYIVETTFHDKSLSYPYGYKVTEAGQNCIVSGLTTDGKLFTEVCK